MNRSPLRHAFILIPLMLACFALAPAARAVCQDACLTNANTLQGDDALLNNTTGYNNTAVGFQTLYFNTTGFANTANGFEALLNNTTGVNNTATGVEALSSNTTGGANTATGVNALESNTEGNDNTATGNNALSDNTTGSFNTATGISALHYNISGSNNTATGANALWSNTGGNDNTAQGFDALMRNINGSDNTAIGSNALDLNENGNSNTAVGFFALFNNATGNDNIAIGAYAGYFYPGSNNIFIGNRGRGGESNTIRIGTNGTHRIAQFAGISGVTVPRGVGVIIDTNGYLGTVVSSARFKDQVKPMNDASEALLSLRPVTFRYKKELDPDAIPQFGLVAEEVEKVDPDLVARDEEGKPYAVRYEAVNAMLLNEFLKEHRKGEQQDRKIEELEATVAKLQSVLKEQAAQIQKVSAELEARKPAPRIVLNNQ